VILSLVRKKKNSLTFDVLYYAAREQKFRGCWRGRRNVSLTPLAREEEETGRDKETTSKRERERERERGLSGVERSTGERDGGERGGGGASGGRRGEGIGGTLPAV